MAEVFRTSRLVQFSETDAAGIAHFSCFFLYMEQAEHELLRSLGESVMKTDDTGKLSWPRVASDCEFCKPLRFEEQVDIAVTIERLGSRSVTYAFLFTHQGERVAKGTVTSVCCRVVPDQPPESVSIPDSLRAKLSPFVDPGSD